MNKTIIVTGSSGEIGTAICKKLIESKYFVIGIDNKKPKIKSIFFQTINVDLEKISSNENYYYQNKKKIETIIKNKKINGLINSAGFQVFKDFKRLTYNASVIFSNNVWFFHWWIIVKTRNIIDNNGYEDKINRGIYDSQYGLCKPKLYIKYEREYLKLDDVRITIDKNIEFTNYQKRSPEKKET